MLQYFLQCVFIFSLYTPNQRHEFNFYNNNTVYFLISHHHRITVVKLYNIPMVLLYEGLK